MKRFSSSNNPIIGDKALERRQPGPPSGSYADQMTVRGAVDKSFMLGAIMLATAAIGYMNPSSLVLYGGLFGGLILVIASVFKPHWSPITAPAYALFEGLFVGAITALYSTAYEGIIFNAVSLTAGLFFLMLFVYRAGIIKVTPGFRTGIIMATGAIFMVYLVSIVLSFFGINMPYLHEASPIGILISVGILAIASLNLLLDFDNFEKGEQYGLERYYEWFFAMGLLVTIVWIYIEVLRLLAILNRD